MRLIAWMALLALAAGLTGAQAASQPGGKPPVLADRAIEQPWMDQLQAGAASETGQPPVQLAFHERPQGRGYFERRGLLQMLFPRRYVQPRYVQPRRTYRSPARTAPRAAPRVQQRRPNAAALAPRPAPAARTPKQRAVDPKFLPTTVDYATEHEPGTIIIDTGEKFLYLVQEDGKAKRYGVGVGREGFGWTGTTTVGRKAEWPSWTPPKEMIGRQPWLAKYARGMPGGPNNPLGARALYLYQGEKDTLFRIHGSNEPWTIGQNVSSGCIRMRNEDVTELYEQVPVGAKVVVL